MENAQYSPGPWHLKETESSFLIEAQPHLKHKDAYVARISWWTRSEGCPTQEESEANARLIAAAPELLEALKVLVQDADKYTGTRFARIDALFDKARAVIAKATEPKVQKTEE